MSSDIQTKTSSSSSSIIKGKLEVESETDFESKMLQSILQVIFY